MTVSPVSAAVCSDFSFQSPKSPCAKRQLIFSTPDVPTIPCLSNLSIKNLEDLCEYSSLQEQTAAVFKTIKGHVLYNFLVDLPTLNLSAHQIEHIGKMIEALQKTTDFDFLSACYKVIQVASLIFLAGGLFSAYAGTLAVWLLEASLKRVMLTAIICFTARFVSEKILSFTKNKIQQTEKQWIENKANLYITSLNEVKADSGNILQEQLKKLSCIHKDLIGEKAKPVKKFLKQSAKHLSYLHSQAFHISNLRMKIERRLNRLKTWELQLYLIENVQEKLQKFNSLELDPLLKFYSAK